MNTPNTTRMIINPMNGMIEFLSPCDMEKKNLVRLLHVANMKSGYIQIEDIGLNYYYQNTIDDQNTRIITIYDNNSTAIVGLIIVSSNDCEILSTSEYHSLVMMQIAKLGIPT